MGKNEEQLICDILNQTAFQEEKGMPLFGKAKEISDFFISYFGKPLMANWKGKDHSKRGDIILKYSNREIEVELKMLGSNGRAKGTLGNITQNFFSIYQIINNGLGWQEWREKNNYVSEVMNLLNSLSYTQDELDLVKNEVMMNASSELELKARALRNRLVKIGIEGKAIAKKAQKLKTHSFSSLTPYFQKSVEVLLAIDALARRDLSGYLENCKKNGINNENLKKLIACLKYGYHTLNLINENFNKPLELIQKESANYYIVYFYPNSNSRFKVEDFKIIGDWINKTKNFEAVIEGESLNVYREQKKILTFKFHWRNVFFGIATPSVEIFDNLYLV